MDGTEAVAGGLVVTGDDGQVLLEFGEEIFVQVSRLVEVAVMGRWLLVRAALGNHAGFARLAQRLDDPILGLVGLVGDHTLGASVGHRHIGPYQVLGPPSVRRNPVGLPGIDDAP